MLNISKNNLLPKGIIVIGSNLTQKASELINELVTDYKADVTEYISDNMLLGEEAKTSIFKKYEQPGEERKYSVIHLNQANLVASEQYVLPLIAEARALKLIFVVEVTNLSSLSTEISQTLFGCIPNYLIGEISDEDRLLLTKLTNGVVNLQQGNPTTLSYLEDENLIRKDIIL